MSRTSSGLGVFLDGQSLAVESVVTGSGELSLHGVVGGIAAEGCLDGWAGKDACGGKTSLVQHCECVCLVRAELADNVNVNINGGWKLILRVMRQARTCNTVQYRRSMTSPHANG